MTPSVAATPIPARTSELSDLAEAACRALGADGAALVLTGPHVDPVVVGDCGLSVAELQAVRATVAGPARGLLAVPGFAAALVEEVGLANGSGVSLCVVQHAARGFENAALAIAFARHAAVAVAGAGAGGERFSRPAPVPPAAGWLSDLGPRLVDGLGFEDLIDAIAQDVAIVLGPTKIGLHLWDEELQVLQMLPGSFGCDVHLTAASRTPELDWENSVARVFATGRTYVTNAAAGDPGVVQDYVAAMGLSRLIVLRLDVGDRRVGVLQVADKGTRFTAADVRAVHERAPGIALALSLSAVRSGLTRRQRIDEILGGIAVDIASGKSLQEFLGPALDALCITMSAAAVALVPVDGEPIVWRRRDDRIELEHILVAEAREANGVRSYVVPSRRVGDPGWAGMLMPVWEDDARVATMAALRHRGEPFAPDERHALSRLAHLIALAWATERYQLQRAALAREAERQRIGDELHDHAAQLLFAARLGLDGALETPDVPAAAAESAERARALIVRADEAIRAVIHDLSGHGQEGLGDLLAAVASDVEHEFGRPVQLEIAPAAVAAARGLRRPVVDLLAKVAREALVNAAKHAGPCQLALRVAVTRRHHLLVAVADDGVGGGRRGGAGHGHGLASLRRAMRRHGGSLRVRIADTGGTTVTASVPL